MLIRYFFALPQATYRTRQGISRASAYITIPAREIYRKYVAKAFMPSLFGMDESISYNMLFFGYKIAGRRGAPPPTISQFIGILTVGDGDHDIPHLIFRRPSRHVNSAFFTLH